MNELIAYVKGSEPITEGGEVFYPGEIEINTRRDNLANGIPVIEEKWNEILAL